MSDVPRTEDGARESWLERLLGRFGHRARESMREDLEEVLSDPNEADDLSPRERLMIKNVLGFHRIRISDVMVPRADMVAIPIETPLREALRLFRTASHSRLPAYRETLDEPLGMIHIRDFLDHIASGGVPRTDGEEGADRAAENLAATDLDRSVGEANLLRPVLFVPRSMPAIDLLARMQASRTHMALVIDEYGGTDGLVSIEDLVETVVGDIEDEHDETEHMIAGEADGSWIVDARASLEEVSEALGQNLERVGGEDVDTLGGLVVTWTGRVPLLGEVIEGPGGLAFEVLDADPRRLKRVRVRRGAAGSGEPAAGAVRQRPSGQAA